MENQEIKQEEEQEQEIIEEFEYETTTRAEYIDCACEAYNTVAESNPMTKEDEEIVKEIKFKCMMIISYYVKEMYDELFES